MHTMDRQGRVLPLFLGLILFVIGPVWAQEQAPNDAAPPPKRQAADAPRKSASKKSANAPASGNVGRSSIVGLFKGANPMLVPLVLCSVVALGYALERLIALRRSRVIPSDFVTRFVERLTTGKLDRDRAGELCRANESPVARIFGHVVRYWGQPAATIRHAIGHDAANELSDLKRNVRVLNGTATLAPLLGLFGTVVGMIEAFDALGGKTAAGTAKSEALAHGISLALMTTAFGLLIAIISVTAYYYLLNRVDVLVRELDNQANKVIDLVAAETSPRPTLDRRPMGELTRQARSEPV
jgi:biopolymer transport protein ExbB